MGVLTLRSLKVVSKFSVKQERRYREILQPIQLKKGVVGLLDVAKPSEILRVNQNDKKRKRAWVG